MTKSLSKDFIAIYDEALSLDDCNLIINKFEEFVIENKDCSHPGSSQFINGQMGRSDLSVFAELHLPEVTNLINNAVHACLLKYCDEFFIIKGLEAESKVVKLQRTDPRGGYHVWHCEQTSKDYSDRLLTWMIYLNDIPQGEGETEFLWQGLRVHPKAGTCLFWPAAYTHTHRGNPVYTHPKYIATGWYTFM